MQLGQWQGAVRVVVSDTWRTSDCVSQTRTECSHTPLRDKQERHPPILCSSRRTFKSVFVFCTRLKDNWGQKSCRRIYLSFSIAGWMGRKCFLKVAFLFPVLLKKNPILSPKIKVVFGGSYCLPRNKPQSLVMEKVVPFPATHLHYLISLEIASSVGIVVDELHWIQLDTNSLVTYCTFPTFLFQ